MNELNSSETHVPNGVIGSGQAVPEPPSKQTRDLSPYLKISSIFILCAIAAPFAGMFFLSATVGGKSGSEFLAIGLIMLSLIGYIVCGPWALVNLALFGVQKKKGASFQNSVIGLVVAAAIVGTFASIYSITQFVLIEAQASLSYERSQRESAARQDERDKKAQALADQLEHEEKLVSSWKDTTPERAIEELKACNVHSFYYDTYIFYKTDSNDSITDVNINESVTGVMISEYKEYPKVELYLRKNTSKELFEAAEAATMSGCVEKWEGIRHSQAMGRNQF